jgi:Yip1-like protein
MNNIFRATAILIDPAAAWPRAAKEPADPLDLMTRYATVAALIPALSGFIGACIIGVIVPGTGVVRASLFDGIFGAIFFYLENFALVGVLGVLVHLAAPLFGGRRNFAAALTLVVYSYTPVWLGGVFLLLPGLRFLMLLGCYGAYLLLVGLPPMIQTKPPQSRLFAALLVAAALILTLFAGWAQHKVFAGALGI